MSQPVDSQPSDLEVTGSVAQPSVVNPSVTQPSVTQPSVTQPSVTQPSVVNPSVVNPSVTQPAGAEAPDSQPSDLEAERDLLLGSIRDLDAEHAAGDLTEDDYNLLRDNYTARAADVLRLLAAVGESEAIGTAGTAPARPGQTSDPARPPETSDPAPANRAPADLSLATGDRTSADPSLSDAVPADPVDPPPDRARSRRRLRRRVAGVGTILLVGGVLLLVWGASGARQTGQSVTGTVPLAPAQELAAARQAMGTGNDVMALKLFQSILNVEPNQPEALAYSGWLLRLAGDADDNSTLVAQGIEAEESAVQADPQYPDARYFLGVMLLDEAHDPSGAVTQLEAYLATHPSTQEAKAVEPILARARAEAATPPSCLR